MNTKFCVFFCVLILCFSTISAQNKCVEKLKMLYEKGLFDDCIEKAQECSKEIPKSAEPYVFIALCNFQKFQKATKESERKNFLRKTIQNVNLAKQKDKEKTILKTYESQITEIHDSLKLFSFRLFSANKRDEAKNFYELLAKTYGDTTSQYRALLNPESDPIAFLPEFKDELENKKVNQVDEKGRKQGKWKKVYRNGKTAYEATFKDDQIVGTQKRFHENGNLASVLQLDAAGKRSVVKFFNESGKIWATGFYNGKLRDSVWNYFNPDSTLLATERYRNGKKNGVYKVFFKNGKLAQESIWEDGELNGYERKYFESGSLMFEASYKKGKRHGGYKKYFVEGNVQCQGFYKDDLRIGKWLFFKQNGSLEEELEYDESGKLKNAAEYEKKESDLLKRLEENKGKLKDPANYLNNPDEYFK